MRRGEGKVDLVAAQLTVTPERQKLVDFTDPTRTNVSEIMVTGPGGPASPMRTNGAGAGRRASRHSLDHGCRPRSTS
jgi:ABC-type amino acid transport substrate-binding protein